MAQVTCSIDGCDKFGRLTVGMCSKHYQRFRRHGDPLWEPRRSRRGEPCAVDGCDEPIRALDWCVTHYHRFNRHGDPLRVDWTPYDGRACAIEGCDRSARANDLCATHWARKSRNGSPGVAAIAVRRRVKVACSVRECEKPARKRGWCTGHYQRWQVHGDPNYGGKPVRDRVTKWPMACAEPGCDLAPEIIAWCRPHYKASYDRANPDKRRRDAALRRSRRIGNTVPAALFTNRDWRRLLIAYRYCCAYCGQRPDRLEVEHVIPLARGGRHAVGNIVPACAPCNRSKNDRLLIEFRYGVRRHRRKTKNDAA